MPVARTRQVSSRRRKRGVAIATAPSPDEAYFGNAIAGSSIHRARLD
jgi:hypothetical protein